MIRRSLLFFLLSLLILSPVSLPARAQNPRPVTPQEDSIIKIRTELISVVVSVTDKRGALVNNLTKDDFELLENSLPQEVVTFGREATQPLNLVLLVDTSSSVKPRLKFEQQAAAKFFKTVVRPVDQAALFSFNHDVSIEQNFTADVDALASATRSLKAKGGTALNDAIFLAAERLEKSQGRRVIVILSDGANTISRTTQEAALRMAERSDAVIYGIYTATRLPNEPGVIQGDKELQKICERTGGDVYFPKDIAELDEQFTQLAAVLRAQYVLTFYSKSDQRDCSYRTLKVNVKNPDLKVRARKGYYAPKE